MTILETWTGRQDRVQEKLDRQAGDQLRQELGQDIGAGPGR
jgi:hypothetical protein